MSLTVVSLFDGIGGFPLAFQRAGADIVATVEIDDGAAAVTATHFPGIRQFTDVRTVTGDDLRTAGFVPARGVVTAGFPCQDLSVAGRRQGLGTGTRSGLYWHVVRLLGELRPAWVLLENVPGLLSATCPCPGDGTCGPACTLDRAPHSTPGGVCPGGCIPTHGGAMGAVLGSLGELGYGFAYRVLDAQYAGVPQRRRRVFIVGHLGDWAAPAEVLLEPESGGGDTPPSRAPGPRTAAALAPRAANAGDAGEVSTHTHRRGDVAGRREPGLPDRRRGGSRWTSGRREVVAALTTSSVGGIGGADDNSAQAGHLIVETIGGAR